MLWDTSRNAGFTEAKPWLRLSRAWRRENVESQDKDLYSSLCLYRRLIELRQHEPSLCTGAYRPVYSDAQVIAYIRREDNHPAFLIVLNLTHRPCIFEPASIRFKGTVVLDIYREMEHCAVENSIDLSGDEGLIVRLDAWEPAASPQS